MFAVIRTGGKQYKVAKDDKIVVEKLLGEPGATIELSDVLMIGGEGKAPTVGTPLVDKAAVFAEVVEQSRAGKIIVFKKNRRKNYRRTRGHRQEQTVLRIVDVSPSGAKPPSKSKAGATKAAPQKTDKKADKPEAEAKAVPKKEAAKKEAPKKKAAPKAPAAKDAAKKKPAAKKKAAPKTPAAKDAAKKKPAAKKKAPGKGTTKGKSKE